MTRPRAWLKRLLQPLLKYLRRRPDNLSDNLPDSRPQNLSQNLPPSPPHGLPYGLSFGLRHLPRALAGALLSLLVVVLLAGAFGAWLLGTASGLRLTTDLAERGFDGRLRIEATEGRLLGPLHIGRLRWQSPEITVNVTDLRLEWTPAALLDGQLSITRLQLATLRLDLPPSTEPARLPASLRLPLTVDVAELAISRLDYGDALAARDLIARFTSDGSRHRLPALRGQIGDIMLHGEATLAGDAPFALEASAELRGLDSLWRVAPRVAAQTLPLALSVSARGPLARLSLNAKNRGALAGGLVAEAEAELTPFAATPLAHLRMNVRNLDPAAWQAGLPQASLQLTADLKPAGSGIAGNFRVENRAPGPVDRRRLPLTQLSGRLDWQEGKLQGLSLRASLPGGASWHGEASWESRAPQAFAIAGELSRFDPSRLWAQAHAALQARLNGRFALQGALQPEARGELSFALADSQWAGHALRGKGELAFAGPRLPRLAIELQAGANRLQANGALGEAGQQLQLQIAAPQLAAFGVDGELFGELTLRGALRRPALSAALHSARLGLPGRLQLRGLRLAAELAEAADAPLAIDLALAGLATPAQPELARDLRLKVDGSPAAHRIEARARLFGEHGVQLAAAGRLRDPYSAPAWQGELQALRWVFAAPATPPVPPAGEGHRPGPGKPAPPAFDGHTASASKPAGPDRAARVIQLQQPAPLALAAERWAIGPLSLGSPGLDGQLTLQATAEARRLQARLVASAAGFGQVSGEVQAGLQGAWQLAEELPWQGQLRHRIEDLAALNPLLDGSAALRGRLSGELSLGGTPAQPRLNGQWNGEGLGLHLPEAGLRLTDGRLDLAFVEQGLRVRQLRFSSPLQPLPRALRQALGEQAAAFTTPGSLEIRGEIPVDRDAGLSGARLDWQLARLGAWQQPDQWIALSGQGHLGWQDGQVALAGALTVDAGYWQLAPAGAPRLSDDVLIRRPGQAARPRPALELDLAIDLGRNFHFAGAGLSSRLAGDLQLSARGRDLPRASGNIRLRDGRFAAYGQQLAIERGVLQFNGLLDNPALDVRAVRRGLAVEPGVQIGGTAQKPVVHLVSDPALPDAEKLSWLVLGHGPERLGSGDAGLLLAAAGGLLGNESGGLVEQLKGRLGIDEFGVRQGTLGGAGRTPGSRVVGSSFDPAASAGGQIFSVGKRLSSNALLSYEQALGKAESLVKLSLELSRQWTLVGRAGSDNAIDLFYTLSFGRAAPAGRPAAAPEAPYPQTSPDTPRQAP